MDDNVSNFIHNSDSLQQPLNPRDRESIKNTKAHSRAKCMSREDLYSFDVYAMLDLRKK